MKKETIGNPGESGNSRYSMYSYIYLIVFMGPLSSEASRETYIQTIELNPVPDHFLGSSSN